MCRTPLVGLPAITFVTNPAPGTMDRDRAARFVAHPGRPSLRPDSRSEVPMSPTPLFAERRARKGARRTWQMPT
jgi:hypothetical protein